MLRHQSILLSIITLFAFPTTGMEGEDQGGAAGKEPGVVQGSLGGETSIVRGGQGYVNIEEELRRVDEQLGKLEGKIEQVEEDIKKAERSTEERQALREEKRQLREKERQLREEKLLLLGERRGPGMLNDLLSSGTIIGMPRF
jgi:peptidoglycan hydrolase CwlO-like protein